VTLPDEFVALAQRVSNWGRWGPDDELGTLNLIDDAALQRAAACVKTGKCFSLAMAFDQNSPQIGSIPGRINPLRTMVAVNTQYMGDVDNFCTSDDIVVMGLQASTHWDALAHASYSGQLYNGFPASAVTVEAGATKCGIGNVATLTTRGVLLDVARATGVDQLEPGHKIQPEELDAALELTDVVVEAGDAVLVRTGHGSHMQSGDRRAYAASAQPGLTMATVPWFRERDAAAVATDTIALECYPGEDERILFPVHLLHLRDMGMTQGQNFDLETLAADCAADGVYEFLLEASPIPFTGGCGAPVNPTAVK
jgi:kynurenine formamidase